MKQIATTEAVGQVLCHDITRIVKDDSKGVAFKKGHIIQEEDIPKLLALGKDNIYIWEQQPGMMHENEAAVILRDISINKNMYATVPSEGKIELVAAEDGLLKVDSKRLQQINSIGEIIIASRHGNFPVKTGDKIAGMRVIPLMIEEEKLNLAQKIADNTPLFSLLPFKNKKAAIITTGNEVFHKRIQDTFTPVIIDKLAEYGTEVIYHTVSPDNKDLTAAAINDALKHNVEIIICTGGMSVDPDDLTPAAIHQSGAEIITYGAPVLPGAMLMLAYHGNVPIVGLPGCVMYCKRTVFDLILPRLLANDRLNVDDLTGLGEGGLCLGCQTCTYPTCGFGK